MITRVSTLPAIGCFAFLLAAELADARAEEQPPGSDEEARQAARALIAEGNKLLEGGQAAGAIERYEAALAVYPSPKIFYNLAEAFRDAGRPLAAAAHYERFLNESEMAPGSKLYLAARRGLAQLDKELARLSVTGSPDGAKLSLDGEPIGTLPLEARRAMPGAHKLAAEMAGHSPSETVVELRAGAQARVGIALAPLPPAGSSLLAASAKESTLERPPVGAAPLEERSSSTIAETASPVGEEQKGLLGEWWLWTAVGVGLAVVVGAVVVAGGSDPFVLDSELRPTSTAEWNRLR